MAVISDGIRDKYREPCLLRHTMNITGNMLAEVEIYVS